MVRQLLLPELSYGHLDNLRQDQLLQGQLLQDSKPQLATLMSSQEQYCRVFLVAQWLDEPHEPR